MDTRKNDSYNIKISLILIVAAMTFINRSSIAQTKTPIEILKSTYKLSETISSAEAKSTISDLVKTLADCEDTYLSFRIKYRIGLMYFRANMFDESKAAFELISNDARCPEPVRACILNMTGQISRLRGNKKSALEAFEKAAAILEQFMFKTNDSASNSFYAKLWCNILFGKAEICEQIKDFDNAIIEYSRLLNGLRQNKSTPGNYFPLAGDRLAQLYLRTGNIDKYVQQAEVLIRDYPQYYRTPIIKLETECVILLRSVLADHKFTNGGFDAPALLIRYVKDNKLENSQQQQISVKLNELCKENQNTYAGILLHYHYACLLDTLGNKDKATEILSQIYKNETIDTKSQFQERLVHKIREYSKIQYAITAGEKADYNEALRVLAGLKTDSDETHISQLAKSVTESIRTLKREVPSNDLVQK